jgi:dihydrofolate reductase
MSAQTKSGRRVVAQISTTLDGRVTGPDGPADMEVIGRYAVSDAAHARSAEALAAATTALLGRANYEGFYGYWPPIVADETADPRDRNIARWLDDVEKVVFTTTMTDAPWTNSRVAKGGPVEEVEQLRSTDGGDILVVNSVSIIRQLLAGEQLDRLLIDLVPEVSGGGATLFEDGVPRSSWSLTDAVTADDGALLLTYDR